MIAGALARTAERLREGGEPYVHATVVRAQHPTSVHAGDAAIVHPDGTVDGFVGGHCALESVRLHAEQVLATGEPLLLRIVPVPEEEEPPEGVVVAHNPCLSGGAFEVFLEPWLPAPRLVVIGEAPMARALAELGRAAGYEVVADAEPHPGDAAVVVASHGEGEEHALDRGAPRRRPLRRARREPHARRVGAGVAGRARRPARARPRPRRARHRRPDAGRGRASRSWPSSSPSARRTLPRSSTRHTAAMGTEAVAGLVLAAGGSRRLGRPKQLLPYGDGTLLDHVLGTARACRFDQLICVLGGSSEDVRATVDLRGADVVVNREFGTGCSSSIATALSTVDPRIDVLVLMLGDQPGVRPETVAALLAGRGDAPLAACRYESGRGHPLAFARSTFGDLATLHGDKGVWRLMDRSDVVEVVVPGAIPRDVDTWADYEAVLAELA